MQRLCLTLLVSALALPAAALAGAQAAGDGTLVVRDANATRIEITGRGTVFGHVDKGTLKVTDYNIEDARDPEVNGKVTSWPVNASGTTWQYQGRDIRFRFFGGRYKIVLTGSGIDVSALGKGTATLIGAGTSDDGDYAVNGGKFASLEAFLPTTTKFGATP
jgi:hypothetical protein